MLKIKEGFIMTEIGDGFIALAAGNAKNDFKDMFRFNETGAFYWNAIEKGVTFDDLVRMALERFEDLDETTAQKDIAEFLDGIAPALIGWGDPKGRVYGE